MPFALFLACMQEHQQLEAEHKQQLTSVNQKLQMLVQERKDLQKQVAMLQEQLQSAHEKAQRASTAAHTSRLQPLAHDTGQQQHGAQEQEQDDVLRASSSGLAGLGLEDQQTPNANSTSRFSLSSLNSQGSTGAAAAAALGSGLMHSTQLNGGDHLHRVGSGLGSQLNSANGSPMAAHARLQQLSSMLSMEGQLHLQRAVQQLQQELSAVSKERDAAAEQLYQMVRQADAATAAMQEAENLKQRQTELQHKVR